MSNFNPNDLTKNIPDDVKNEEQTRSTLDFIEECKADKENGIPSLVMSAAATLALNMHQEMCRLITGHSDTGGEMFKAIWDALPPHAQVVVLQAAGHSLSLGITKTLMDDAKKNPGALMHTISSSKMSFDVAKSLADDIAQSIAAMKAADSNPGSFTKNVNGSQLHARPIQKNKPH